LILFPLEAATCAVVFFGGGWRDGAVAALCGLVCGLIDWNVGMLGEVGSVILDLFVGKVDFCVLFFVVGVLVVSCLLLFSLMVA
jgi:hypothetical protein